MTELVIRVHGYPAKQGSKDFKGMIGRRPRLVESDEKLPDWRKAVIEACQSAIVASGWLKLDCAVEVVAEVFLPRPKSVTREYPDRQSDGDDDKYARALLDAMTLGRVYVDDSRVCNLSVRKRYADGRAPGATIRVRPLASQGTLL